MRAYPGAIGIKCPVMNLYPFQLAVLSLIRSIHDYENREKLAIERTYMLLRKSPAMVLEHWTEFYLS
jgi:hypothetical protein